MNFPTRSATLVMLCALLPACAQLPKSSVAESQFDTLSCAELAHETLQGTTTKLAADQARSDAWHAVIPFVVAARYSHAASASREAERRLTLLAEQADRRACDV